MYEDDTIGPGETSKVLRMDSASIGPQIALVIITGGTGNVTIEGTLSDPEPNGDFSNAIWHEIEIVSSGTDSFVRTGPWSAFRANGTSLSAGSALIQVRQAYRV